MMGTWLLPGFLAIVLHEMAHAYVAYINGDWTGKVAGRVTLNPAKHMDPVGSVFVPMITFLLLGLPLGWAKPVPINFMVLTGLQRIRVALAGPLCNLLQAGVWGMLMVGTTLLDIRAHWLDTMCMGGVIINGLLFAINMLPLLPLDGGHVLYVLLPPRWSRAMVRYQWAQTVLIGGALGLLAVWWRQ